MHFFNPVSAMPLVELVRPESASDEAVSTVFAAADEMRKSAILCADTRGFIVNRLLARIMLAASEAARSGTPIGDIDAAVEGAGLPMGPFALIELVGVPVAGGVTTTMHRAYPERFPADELIGSLAKSGINRIYDGEGADRRVAAEVEQFVDFGGDGWSADQVRERVFEALAEEAGAMLAEGAVADPRDIDTAMILGAGFPLFLGGICIHLDQTGVSRRILGRELLSAG